MKRIYLGGFVSLLLVLALSACTESRPDPQMKLYVFDCGDILVRDVSVFSPGVDVGKPKEMTDSCYLVVHPKGTLLWDTGLNDALGAKGVDVWDGVFHLSMKNPLMGQLREIGVKPQDIDYVGVSHFHGDHSGNLNEFTDATVLIQQQEFDAAFGPEPTKFHFAPETYNKIDKSKVKALSGDFDVFGDGRVVIKRALGHTPGHQVLFLDLPKTGPILLSGDLYHFTKNRTYRRVPSFNFSKEQTLQAMEQIEAFVKQRHAVMWIQHDKEQNATIKHSPAFYQ